MRARQGSHPTDPGRSFIRKDTNRASATVVHYAIVNLMFNTVNSFYMDGTLILSAARKAIMVRLAALHRHFCQDDVNEMVSMTVERFFTKGAYDPSKSAIQTYVSRIAAHVASEFVKKTDKAKARSRSLDAPDSPLSGHDIRFADSRGTDSVLLDEEQEYRLSRAVARLPLRQQAYFKFVCEGRPYREIATLTGTTENNVSLQVFRLKNRLAADFRETA